MPMFLSGIATNNSITQFKQNKQKSSAKVLSEGKSPSWNKKQIAWSYLIRRNGSYSSF